MNKKHRDEMDELKLAEQTARVLESGDCSDRDAAATYELGRLLRQSADHELPESNQELREQLLMELTEDGDAPMVATKSPLKESSSRVSRKRMWMGVAAGALVAVGGWWLYQPQSGFGVNLNGGMDMVGDLDLTGFPAAEIAAEPTALGQDGKFEKSIRFVDGDDNLERNEESREQYNFVVDAKPNDRLNVADESKVGTLESLDTVSKAIGEKVIQDGPVAYGKQRGGQKSQPGGELGQQNQQPASVDFGLSDHFANDGRSRRAASLARGVVPKRHNFYRHQSGGEAIELSRLSTTTESKAVSVPDGGTVESRGIRGYVAGKGNGTWFDENGIELGESLRFEESLGREQYIPIHENAFVNASGGAAISTFSIDVDTASYANMRRFLNAGQKPPRDSIRIEELVNYFQYDYPQPQGDDPFSVNMELASCPWNDGHKLLRVGLKGKEIHVQERPATNLVYLIDVSGSMNSADKLPLLKRGFQMMTKQLGENDRVSIVTYAGNAGVALEPTTGDNTKTINDAIERLAPGGSTHGSAGIELAYKLAQQHFITGGVNKVILATDGDLNVGVTADGALVKLIKQKASEGVFLTVLGFGTGNLQDGKLEKLADNGNGHYAYLDSNREAHRVLVQQMSGSLVTIAKDVKIQIEFNPAEVKSYRLIGYENRMLATKDFDDDRKDAGEIGAGHTVTAIYELEPAGSTAAAFATPKGMKYQTAEESPEKSMAKTMENLTGAAASGELATVALRYKNPDENTSKRIEFTIKNDEKSFTSASDDFRFAASVAGFGMLLRGSEHAGTVDPGMILEMASESIGDDTTGYRAEFIDLVRKAFSR